MSEVSEYTSKTARDLAAALKQISCDVGKNPDLDPPRRQSTMALQNHLVSTSLNF